MRKIQVVDHAPDSRLETRFKVNYAPWNVASFLSETEAQAFATKLEEALKHGPPFQEHDIGHVKGVTRALYRELKS